MHGGLYVPSDQILLFDEDRITHDDLAATGALDVRDLLENKFVTVALTPEKKCKNRPTLTIQLNQATPIKTHGTVVAELKHYHVPHSAEKSSVFLPFSGWPVQLAIEWEGKGKLDLKLISSEENVWLDWFSKDSLDVERKISSNPALKGQAKLKISPKDDLSSLCARFSRCELLERGTLGDIVKKAGWKGTMGFNEAKAKLQGVMCDEKSQRIFFPVKEDYSYFICDWDDADVDFKLLVTPAAHSFYDLSVAAGKGGDYSKKSKTYNPPKSFLDGKIICSKLLELEDLTGRLVFSDFKWEEYRFVGDICHRLLSQIVSLTI